MWTLLKAGYGDYNSVSARTDMGKLDPILCARNVSTAKIKLMIKLAQQIGAFFASDLLKLLYDEVEVSKIISITENPRRIRYSNVKYQEHFKDLIEWRLLEQCNPEFIRFFATYFSVPKDEILDRSIFNGRILSTMTQTPPTVNLADVPRVIRELNLLSENHPEGFFHNRWRYSSLVPSIGIGAGSISLFWTRDK